MFGCRVKEHKEKGENIKLIKKWKSRIEWPLVLTVRQIRKDKSVGQVGYVWVS